MKTAWTVSRCEEVIACLWIIICLMSYSMDITWLFWITLVKAVSDTGVSIVAAAIEALSKTNLDELLKRRKKCQKK